MLFFIPLILIAVGILIEKFSVRDFVSDLGEILAFVSTIGAVILFVLIIIFQLSGRTSLESNKERYKALTYKIERKSYRDDFGLLKKEVIDEIQDWNEDLTFYKSNQRDFWIGIFIPNIYDEFELIDYEKFQ